MYVSHSMDRKRGEGDIRYNVSRYLLYLIIIIIVPGDAVCLNCYKNSRKSAPNSEMPISHPNIIIFMIKDTNEKGHSNDGREKTILLTDENVGKA